jgi:hypothetical protein
MTRVQQLIDRLRSRSDLTVDDRTDAWLIRIAKEPPLICEVTIPRDRFEWFAEVRSVTEQKEVWSDWMDHYGAAKDNLDDEMARCIADFVERVLRHGLRVPLHIYEARA